MTLQQTCSNYEKSAALHEPRSEPFFSADIQQGRVKEGGTGRGANANKHVRKCKRSKHRRRETTQKKARTLLFTALFVSLSALSEASVRSHAAARSSGTSV